MPANLDALISRIDLPALIEATTKISLHRNGSRGELRGPCPLHGGDNPTAFAIHLQGDRQTWTCFTRCADGHGDAIDFYRRLRNLDFKDAVTELAERYKVPLAEIGWNQPADQQAIIEHRNNQNILRLAADHYAASLWSPAGAPALAYLRSRALSDETIRGLSLGYTDGHTLAAELNSQPSIAAAAHKLGLLRADNLDYTANANGLTAAPHGYITIPHFLGGRITYLTSRAVEIEGSPRPDPADKSRNLPGPRQLYRAESKSDPDSVTLCEGPLDAASLYQAGRTAWALCGLGSLPADDLARLRRRKSIYLAADSDPAGRASLEAAQSKISQSLTTLGPLTLILPPIEPSYGKDYNAWLQHDAAMTGLTAHYTDATTWLENRLRQAAACPDHETDQRMLEIGALLAAIPEAAQTRYYTLANKILHLTRGEITNLIRQAAQAESGYKLGAIRDGILHFAGRPLLNGSIQIARELIMDDGQDTPTVAFSITGKLANGQPLDTVEVPAEEFDTFKWVPRHWGRQAILYCSKGQYYELARAVQEISTEAIRERVYTYTGWTRLDGKPAYLTAAGAITADGHNPNVRVDLGNNNLRHYSLPTPPTGPDAYDAVQASLDFLRIGPASITAPIWAAMYAAPLSEIAPLYAMMWVYGQTQSGKSTIMHLALTHFGSGFVQGRQYHAPIDWTSTTTALEGSMFIAKDTPIVIDDFAPQFASAADSRDMHRKASIAIRSVGNRSSRNRARADLTARKERIPRGLVISTAENPLMGQSIVGRMIYVPIGRGEIVPLDGKQNPALDEAQAHGQRGFYAQAMSLYIQWLAANYERIANELPARLNAAAAYARQKSATIQGRLPDYFATLAVGQKIALECFVEMGIISKMEMERIHEKNVLAILGVVSQQAERIASESPLRKIFEGLSALLSRRVIYLAPRTGGHNYIPPERAELLGWHGNKSDEQHLIYLDTRQAIIMAREYWQRLGENLDILPDAMLMQARNIPGLIAQSGEAGRDEASIFAAGKARRLLVLDRRRILELYGVDLSNESAFSNDGE